MSNDMPALDVEPVHQPNYVSRHPVDRVSNPTLVALPDAAMIEGDDLEPFGERSYLIPPKGSEAAEPRYEHDGEADAVSLTIERAVTN
jgi:hypothetical protein